MKCLIIDDNENNRLVARYILEELAIQSDEAEGVTSALSMVVSGEYDFILLDWMMPDIDGIEFLHLIRESKEGQKCKIIMCTAKTTVADQLAAIEAGANAFISKPITLEQIRTTLKEIGVSAGS